MLSGTHNDLNLASLALGGLTRGVTPLELAASYTPLANHGIKVEPLAILKITDRFGNVLLERRPSRKVVLSEATAYVMTNMLRRVVTNGTGRNAYIGDYHPVAGKTGTATNNVNAWFVGYTPSLLATVWFGQRSPGSVVALWSGEAARLWAIFMRQATAQTTGRKLHRPGRRNGRNRHLPGHGELFSDICPATDQDYAIFLDGTQPQVACSLHGGTADPTITQPPDGLIPPTGDGTGQTNPTGEDSGPSTGLHRERCAGQCLLPERGRGDQDLPQGRGAHAVLHAPQSVDGRAVSAKREILKGGE